MNTSDNKRSKNFRQKPAHSKSGAAQEEAPEFVENIVQINRVAKVVKGGRRFSFSALAVVGDQKGRVGYGIGKAKEVPDAIRKAIENAKKSLINISRARTTIPHSALGKHDGGNVLLRPASEGTGVVAGPGVRDVLEAAGVNDILTKSLGSNNKFALVAATFAALKQIRSKDAIMAARRAK